MSASPGTRGTVENLINDFIANSPKAQKLNLEFLPEKNNFNINADQNKIRQVISNIIDNAIKYTFDGSIKVFLSHNYEKNKVLIKIQDSGIGINKETMPRLFQKFTRAEKISRFHTDGAGLGLYVARRIVEDHKGKIWAESEGKNKGSTFYIELLVS